MENIITLFPYAGQLTRSPRREPEVTSRFPRRRVFAQDKGSAREGNRSIYLVGISRRVERIYGLANLVAVVVMAAALVTAFATYLTSFVG
jgi:hypothetical protein